MADDIDIEEHDVLDNPRIKDIFPELTKIKTEVLDIDEQENLDFDSCERDIETPNEEAFETRPRGNKIILGSKPSGSSSIHSLENPLCFGYQLNIKQESVYDESDDNLSPLEGNNENNSSSLMLASESGQNDYHEDDVLDDKVSNSIVYLEDWGPRLDRSHCYCQECMILFPTRNCLDAHNMVSHSFLVALAVNKAVKSTSKPPTLNFNKGTARKSTSYNDSFGNNIKSLGSNVQKLGSNVQTFGSKVQTFGSNVQTFGSNVQTLGSNVQTLGSNVKTTARKSTGLTGDVNSSKSSRFCNHCNKTFVSDTELIKHLYENLTFGKLKCELCDGIFNDADELQSHMETHTDNDDEFYRCNICHIFNKYKASYESHMRFCHNVEKCNYTKQPFSGQCLLCPHRCELPRYYTRHVKDVHKTIFYEKVTDSVEITKPAIMDRAVPSTSKADAANNQCQICKLSFNMPQSLRSHIQRKHPQWYSQVYNPSLNKNFDNANPLNLIPKNTLFKCNNCDVHFVLPSVALIHSRTCKKATGEWNCVKCDINFNLADEDMHSNQHNFNNTFKVYLIDEIVYEKVLCKCPDCKTYLDDQSFWKHCQNECDSRNTICDICDWPINNNCLEKHKKTHDKYNIINTFIRIEFVKNDNEIKNNLVFLFCPTCRCCIRGNKYIGHHIRGLCKNPALIHYKKHICKICGLLVRSNRHDDFHKSHPQVKLLDMKFVRVTDKKPIAPPIPIYPKCTKCNVCFLSKIALNRHDCKDNYRTCDTCMEKFSDLAYKLHVPFHSKHANMSTNDSVIKKAVMPKLIEKYNMVTKTWNFLFLCKACDIMTDSYDKAVEHCQNHYNNLESYGVTITKCNICDFKFDSSCYEKHRAKHNSNKSLNKHSFKVFEYDYKQLFYNECWSEMFNNLPETDIEHIISNSIYRFVRTLKMKIISMGAPEFTVYKCSKCKRFVNPPMVVLHYNQCLGLAKAIGKRCYQCNGLYSSSAGLEFHKLQHKNYNKMKMRIVMFNDYEDAEFNKALNTPGKAPICKIKPKIKQRAVYYKCAKCKCCSRAVAAAVHVCKPAKYRRQCPKCKLMFSSNFDKHLRLHQGIANFRYKIVPMKAKGGKTAATIGDYNNKNAEVKKIFKCNCDLHFITPNSLTEHLKKCDIKNPVPSEKCSKCSLRFPTSVLVNHLLLHHANKKNVEFVVDTMNTYTVLHKCGKCDLHFSSEIAVIKHYDSKHVIDFEVSSCTTCGLSFSVADLQYHEANYHDRTSYIKVCSYKPNKCVFDKTEVVCMGQFRKELVRLDCFSAELVKCRDCETHFLSYSRFYGHLANSSVRTETAPCDICGLTFRKFVMPTHKYVHHEKMGLTREDFEIKDTESSYMGGAKRVCPFKLRDKQDEKVDSDLEISEERDVSEDVSDDQPVNATPMSTPPIEAYKNYSRHLFKCDICSVHLLTTNSLNKHPQLCGTVPKSTCRKCKLVFHKKSLSKHMKVHHKKMKLGKKDMMVSNIYDLKDITKKVPEINDSKNVPDINTSKYASSSKNVKELYKRSKKCGIYVFKCNVCSLHFLNELNVIQHVINANHQEAYKNCVPCNKNFSARAYYRHKVLHHDTLRLTGEDIRVITCHKSNDNTMINDALFRCHKCEVCFMKENSFNKHLSVGCNRDLAKRELCETCNLYFSPRCGANHKSIQHDYLNLEPQDIIVIDYLRDVAKLDGRSENDSYVGDPDLNKTLNESNSSKSVVVNNLKRYVKSKNKLNVDTLYKCKQCDLCFLTLSALNSHFYSNHPQVTVRQCDLCHNKFSSQSYPNHKKYHHYVSKVGKKDIHVMEFDKKTLQIYKRALKLKSNETKSRSINDAFKSRSINNTFKSRSDVNTPKRRAKRFYRISDKTKAKLRVSYEKCVYKCKQCSMHYINSRSMEKHQYKNCMGIKPNSVKCDICDRDFNLESLYRHKYIHHEFLRLGKDLEVVLIENAAEIKIINNKKQTEPKKFEDVMPQDSVESTFIDSDEDDEKDQSKSNILYKCTDCNLCFLNLKSRYTHIVRGHPMSSKVSCAVCYHNFTHQTLEKHVKIHHSIRKLGRDDFNVVATPDSRRAKTSHILSEKSKAKLRESYETCVYKCKNCSMHFITSGSMKKHRKCTESKLMKVKCDICDRDFSLVSLIKHKYIHHEFLGLGKDLEVVLIENGYRHKKNSCKKGNELNKSEAESNDVTSQDSVDSILIDSDEDDDKDKSKSNILYRCTDCNLCFLNVETRNIHIKRGHPVSSKVPCAVCYYNFTHQTLEKHVRLHHTIGKLGRDDFYVKSRPFVATKSRRAKTFYKLSEKSKAKLRESYETCVFKCKKCLLHYISYHSVEKHKYNNCNERKLMSVKCDICDLNFSLVSFYKHKYIHHEFLGLGKDLEVVLVQNGGQDKSVSNRKLNESKKSEVESNDVTSQDSIDSIFIDSDEDDDKDKSKSNTLYRCTKCNLCFINVASRKTHIRRGHPMSSKVPCVVCYNNFTHQTLEKHVKIHHTLGKLGKDDLNVIDELNTSMLNESTDFDTTVKKYTSNKNKSVSKDVSMNDLTVKNKIISNVSMDSSDVKYNLSGASKKKLRNQAKNCVYVCTNCNSTFIAFLSVERHLYKCNGQYFQNIQCNICDLHFPCVSYKKHAYIHHEYLKLGKDDLNIVKVDRDNLGKLKEQSVKNSVPEDTLSETDRESTSTDVFDVELLESRKRRIQEDNDRISVTSDDTNATIEKKRKISANSDVITLFKCSVCKVYFVSKATCLKHIWKHTKLDDTEHIECKFCSLPFRILSLHKHTQLHHKTEFKLENVLVEEYCPRPDGKQPEPEVYYALDKLQSKLVSTTTERDNDMDDDDSESKDVGNSMGDASNARLSDLIAFEDN